MAQTADAPLFDAAELFAPSVSQPQDGSAPFLDGGWGFAPSLSEVNPVDLEVLWDGAEVDAKARQFRDVIADTGSWSFQVQRSVQGSLLVDEDGDPIVDGGTPILTGSTLPGFDEIVRFRVHGVTAFQGIVEAIDHVALAQGEEAEQTITFSGRGALALLDQAVVYPSRGVGAIPIEDVRSFSWPSPDFDDTTWPQAKKVNRQRSYADWLGPVPWLWPDTTAWFIWANLPTVNAFDAPVGTCLFRKTFTLDDPELLRIYVAFDNDGTLYIDGAEMTEFTSYTQAQFVEIPLGAGEHVIALRGENLPLTIGGHNPGGVIAAGFTVGAGGLLDELVFNTDATWKCLPYPTELPGFTHGQVLRILLEEAGLDSVVDLDFTDTLDSAGQPWSAFREISVHVGRTLLEVVRELSDAYLDVAMAPGSLTLRAWNRGTRGSVRSVTLQQTSDPATSDFVGLSHAGKRTRMNTTLIRYAGGHLEEEDTASVSAHGVRAGYLEMGAVTGDAEARKMAQELMETRAVPSFSTQATIQPRGLVSTPYVSYGVGDWIVCPDESNVPTEMRVRGLTLSEDADGVVQWPLELRDAQFEIEERHEVWLRRMADGAALGGARVSSPAGSPPPVARQVSELRVARFSFDYLESGSTHGTLVASFSPIETSPVTGNVVEVHGEVTTPGSGTTVRVWIGTSTTVSSGERIINPSHGGTSFYTITIPSGVRSLEVPVNRLPVRANVDLVQVQIVTPGGAKGLVVQVRAL